MTPLLPEFHSATQPWHSQAGGGVTLRGRRIARADVPLIHFIHGNGFSGGTYWPLLHSFADRYALFCHDLEGHGQSDAPAHYSGTPAIIRRIAHVMDEQCGARAPIIGIGHSFGAAVTLGVAAAQPQRFSALVLLDPILLPRAHWLAVKAASAFSRNPMAQGARRRRSQWDSRDQVLEKLRGRGIYRGWQDDALACFVDYATRDTDDGRRQLCCPTEIEASIFEQPIYPWPMIRRLRTPTLLIHGQGSYAFFKPALKAIRRLNPGIQIEAVNGGHCFMQEDPEPTARLINGFLARHNL
ncbi:alpha/beta fold hydrolase [Sinimarinibacterium sp. NLF-5-8]|uniref:alpha/beta fold hydrolase n=1 Tax=Sinimarinibacterium sp. NLF-5-8 TaxID=2698684 RepID=UPI00137BC960|nr:alpha/beta hydrolase [Sinimarinibacterium sp. NLF-5-8]QHS10198.1 alpha/beta hydrolase [Sinimarinibacterium sp. NLF-5-8]